MISIILVSWTDYKYLKPCLESIKKFTTLDYEILIHLNTYDDVICNLAQEYDPGYTKTITNEGLAYGSNRCVERAKGKFLFMPNSDTIILPQWDTTLMDAVSKYGNSNMYCSVMIEPFGSNPDCIIKNYGTEPENFNLSDILDNLESHRKHECVIGNKSPWLLRTDLYTPMDERMWPGWVTDNDFMVSLYTQDNNIKYIRVLDSLIYHFMCKSTHRIGTEQERWNIGLKSKQIFTDKWPKIYPGMTYDNYRSYIYGNSI